MPMIWLLLITNIWNIVVNCVSGHDRLENWVDWPNQSWLVKEWKVLVDVSFEKFQINKFEKNIIES